MKKKKCMECGGTTPKMAKGGFAKATVGGDDKKFGIYGTAQSGGTGPITMKKGGSKVTAVKHSCPAGYVRSATGGCIKERQPMAKKGGIAKKQSGGPVEPTKSNSGIGKKIAIGAGVAAVVGSTAKSIAKGMKMKKEMKAKAKQTKTK